METYCLEYHMTKSAWNILHVILYLYIAATSPAAKVNGHCYHIIIQNDHLRQRQAMYWHWNLNIRLSQIYTFAVVTHYLCSLWKACLYKDILFSCYSKFCVFNYRNTSFLFFKAHFITVRNSSIYLVRLFSWYFMCFVRVYSSLKNMKSITSTIIRQSFYSVYIMNMLYFNAHR